MNFFYDEWDFVTGYRPGQATSILFPHNEHWSTIPILIWKLLFVLVGLRSHLPYEAVALGAHLACVFLLFALIRLRSGDVPAFFGALILLVLGSGVTNIIWAFQVTWTLSIAFGLLTLLLIESSPRAVRPWRVAAISGAMLASLMSSGIGLGFLVAATVELLLDRGRRRYLVALGVPIAAYLAWFLVFGAGLAGTPGAPCPSCPTAFGTDVRAIGPGYLANVLTYASIGLRASAAGVVGLAGVAGLVVPGLLLVLLAGHWYVQGRIESWELATVAGLAAQFILIGLVRVRFGFGGAADSHYVYVGVVYFLPLVANSVKRLPWRGVWRVAVPAAFAIATVANAIQLVDQAISHTELMRTENAELRTVESFRGAPDMALNRPLDREIMPQLTASTYYAAIDVLGSPIRSSTPESLSDLPAKAVDQEMLVLFQDALKVTPTSQQAAQGMPCQKVDSSAGSVLDLRVRSGRSIVMTGAAAGDATISLGFMVSPTSWPFLRQVQIPAATAVQLHLPDTGKPIIWRLRVAVSRVGELQVCGADSLQVLPVGS
jgi:hypothetical protein